MFLIILRFWIFRTVEVKSYHFAINCNIYKLVYYYFTKVLSLIYVSLCLVHSTIWKSGQNICWQFVGFMFWKHLRGVSFDLYSYVWGFPARARKHYNLKASLKNFSNMLDFSKKNQFWKPSHFFEILVIWNQKSSTIDDISS